MNKRVFIISIVTILLIRSILPFLPQFQSGSVQFYIHGFRWHHFYSGLVMCLLALAIPKRSQWLVQGIAMGLIIDEVTLPLYLSGFHQFTYWYLGSVAGVVVALSIYGYLVLKKYNVHSV